MFASTKKLFNITIIYNKSNHFGLEKDALLLKKALSGKAIVRFADPLEPPVSADINIHLEIPIYVYVPWAPHNILVVNPEWYIADAWDPYLKYFDVITKEKLNIADSILLPWCSEPVPNIKVSKVKEFLYLLGGSKNKNSFGKEFIKCWKESYPPLHVYTTVPLDIEVPNVIITVKDLTPLEIHTLQQTYTGHVCCSSAEGFSYTAAEAVMLNAFTILNTLPVYVQDYSSNPNVYFIETPTQPIEHYIHSSYVSSYEFISRDLEKCITSFLQRDSTVVVSNREELFKKKLIKILNNIVVKTKIKTLPPVLTAEDCPRISIITLLYNRRRFFDLACHNIMISDYPKSKIEWIIVEDSSDPNEDSSDKIQQVAEASQPMNIVYVPLAKKTTIARKRNIGALKASNDIILFMDDDDHYPITSFRRRVAWLTHHTMDVKATVCTTIACYDLIKGISAVNTPPFELSLGQRISEATLTCYKTWLLAKPFDQNIQIGEGESLVCGRESDVMEIPPQQIIVAFSHGKNASSRRIPSNDSVEPSCFWGFPPEYLQFIHKLAGVTVI